MKKKFLYKAISSSTVPLHSFHSMFIEGEQYILQCYRANDNKVHGFWSVTGLFKNKKGENLYTTKPMLKSVCKQHLELVNKVDKLL